VVDSKLDILSKFNIHSVEQPIQAGNLEKMHDLCINSRSTADPALIYPIRGWELKVGDKCEKGSQLRPNIVWFGEMVPKMDEAIQEALVADIFIVIGTSMVVYPAAGLIEYVKDQIPIYVIDPNLPEIPVKPNFKFINEKGSVGMKKLYNELVKDS